jgi:hypothetical protein
MRTMLLAALIGIGLADAAQADPVTDALFAEGIFDTLPDGKEIAYSHVRSGPASADYPPVTDGQMRLVTGATTDGGRNLTLTIEAEGRQRQVVDFPASGGNPVLMVFLESSVRSMAAITGGSPFYIRNRIKDALHQGGALTEVATDYAGHPVAARELTLRPFADDPNRARMGLFADLTLRFVVADEVPGHFLLLAADTPDGSAPETPGYHEAITLASPDVTE